MDRAETEKLITSDGTLQRLGMHMNDQCRPTRAEPVAAERKTFTGNRGLAIEEALLFEIGRPEITGVDIDVPPTKADRLRKLRRKTPINLTGLSEPEAMRHYVRLSQKN